MWLCRRSLFPPLPPAAVADVGVLRAFRSACPGKHFAIRMLFTTIASMIATLDIKKAVDEHGNEVTPDPEFNPGIIM